MSMRFKTIFTLLNLVSALGYSQVQEQLSPTEKRFQTPVTEPLTLYKGFFRAGVSFGFSVGDNVFDKHGKKVLIESNALGTLWSVLPYVQYGITDRLQVEVELPYHKTDFTLSTIYEVSGIDSVFKTNYNNPTKGVADPILRIGYQILPGSYTKPFLGVFVSGIFPLAEKNIKQDPDDPNDVIGASGSGEFQLEASVRYRKIVFPYSYEFSVSYTNRFGGKKILDVKDKQERSFKGSNLLRANAAFNLHLNNWIIFKNILDFSYFGEGETDGVKGETAWMVGMNPALIFQRKGFRTGFGMNWPMVGKILPANLLYVMNVTYTF